MITITIIIIMTDLDIDKRINLVKINTYLFKFKGKR